MRRHRGRFPLGTVVSLKVTTITIWQKEATFLLQM